MDLKPLTRELHSDERRKLLAHLLAFGTEDRRLRFGHALSDDGVCHYVEEIDLSRDAIFVVNDADLAIIGAAQPRARRRACPTDDIPADKVIE